MYVGGQVGIQKDEAKRRLTFPTLGVDCMRDVKYEKNKLLKKGINTFHDNSTFLIRNFDDARDLLIYNATSEPGL
jgi:hypothetical protein